MKTGAMLAGACVTGVMLAGGSVLAADAAKTYSLWDGKETQAEYAKRAGIKDVELTLDLGNKVELKLILIPAGNFLMGNPVEERAMTEKEFPQHQVTISKPFYLAIYETTQAQYEQVTGKNGNFKKNEKMDVQTAWEIATGSGKEYQKDPDMPVDNIDYAEAIAFCEALGKKIGRKATLVTEAQWEYAYRAGTTTRFYWGDDSAKNVVSQYAWFGDQKSGPMRVGQKKPNRWGLYDMAGNSSDICLDDYRVYTPEPVTDPVGRGIGALRGGYFGNETPWLTAYHRKGVGDPHYKMDVIGKWKGRFNAGSPRVLLPVEPDAAK